jgi:hypothetical protein
VRRCLCNFVTVLSTNYRKRVGFELVSNISKPKARLLLGFKGLTYHLSIATSMITVTGYFISPRVYSDINSDVLVCIYNACELDFTTVGLLLQNR